MSSVFLYLLIAVFQDNLLSPHCVSVLYDVGSDLRKRPIEEHAKIVQSHRSRDEIRKCVDQLFLTSETAIDGLGAATKREYPNALWGCILWIQASEGETAITNKLEDTLNSDETVHRYCFAIGFCAFNAPKKNLTRSQVHKALTTVIRNPNRSWGTRVEALIALRRFEFRFPGIFDEEIKRFAKANIVGNADFLQLEPELKQNHINYSFTARPGHDFGLQDGNRPSIVSPYPGWDETLTLIRESEISRWSIALRVIAVSVVIIGIVLSYLCYRIRKIMPI